MCALVNGGSEPFEIRPGDRIAQMVFLPVYVADLMVVEELRADGRGAGGFGHTGVSRAIVDPACCHGDPGS